MKQRTMTVLFGAASLVALVGAPAGAASQATIDIPGFRYTPSVLNVTVGDTVVFRTTGGEPHSAVNEPTSSLVFDTGELIPGQSSAPILATTAGTFDYYCGIHGRSMVGRIVVQDAVPPVVPESPWAVGLGLSAAGVLALAAARRRRGSSAPSLA